MGGYWNAPLRIWDDNGIIRRPGVENKVSRVIHVISRDGIRKLAARVVVSVKHILDAIPSLRCSQACPEDLSGKRIPHQCDKFARRRIKKHPTTHGSHIWVVDPGFDIEWAD